MKVLLFSTLYPSEARPGHGVFVETRLRELLHDHPDVEARVVAPVPWFPSSDPRWGSYAQIARTPAAAHRNGIEVIHPRYLLPPKVGMSVAPLLLALAGWRTARRLRRAGFDFDLIDAHYFYPDGVAAALMSAWLRKPFVVTARGSDINLIAQYRVPRAWIRWAAGRAAACIGVSGALTEAMRNLGMPGQRLWVVRNGVDTRRFRMLDRQASRAQIGHPGGPLLLSVGNLVPLKGHDLCIDALARVRQHHPQARLVILGAGPEHARLQSLAAERGLSDAVRLAGTVPNAELAPWYSAADVLLLASSREGWPNVLLEAMACGTPVVATRVGGVPEIVDAPRTGRLVAERTSVALADAVRSLLDAPPSREEVSAYASGFGWDHTSRLQRSIFATALNPETRHA